MTEHEKEQIENPNVGGMSTKALTTVFIGYAFSRSIKPSSSYLAHYFGYVDRISKEVPNYQDLSPLYHSKIQPVATMSQLLFYILVVLFSSHIGFDVVIWIDIFCQMANVGITMLPRMEFFRTLIVAQAGTFVYGIATATGNVFHNYAYCVFEKEMFVRISGYTRSATMLGHLAGSLIGAAIWSICFEEVKSFCKLFISQYAPPTDPRTVDAHFPKYFKSIAIATDYRLITGTLLMLGLTILFMGFALVVSFWFPKLSAEAKRKNRKSLSQSLKAIYYAGREFKNRSVAFWSLAWTFSFMSMLYSKQWCPNMWKHHQERLSSPVLNSYFDACAYVSGAIGALVPGMVTKRLGFQSSVALQLFLTAAGGALAFLQFFNLPHMAFYYAAHILFSFVVYYSMAYQSGELARSISHDKIKLIFYILNASTFILQCTLNFFCEGLFHMPEIDFVTKYLLMTGFMIFNFLIVFIGFSGMKREQLTQHKDVELNSKPSSPIANNNNEEQQLQKSEEEGEKEESK